VFLLKFETKMTLDRSRLKIGISKVSRCESASSTRIARAVARVHDVLKGVPHGERLSVACFDDLEDARWNCREMWPRRATDSRSQTAAHSDCADRLKPNIVFSKRDSYQRRGSLTVCKVESYILTLPRRMHPHLRKSWLEDEGGLNPKAGKQIANYFPERKLRVGGRDRTVNLDFGQNLGTIFALLLIFGGCQTRNFPSAEARKVGNYLFCS